MCCLYFVCIGFDVVMFFLQIRLIFQFRKFRWLVPVDDAGKSLVDLITARVAVKTNHQLSEKGELIVALAAFAVARIVLEVLLRLA
jgi:hypothetical protein